MAKYVGEVFSASWSTILQPWKWGRKSKTVDPEDPETPTKKLVPTHQSIMEEFIQAFEAREDHPYLKDPIWRSLVYQRFLVARSWDLKKAIKMLSDALDWRTSYGTDDIPFFPPPKGFMKGYNIKELYQLYDRPLRNDKKLDHMLELLREGYHGTWHKWDREGHPVYIERSGYCDPRVICNSGRQASKEDGGKKPWEEYLLKGHVLFMEMGCHLANYQTRKLKKPVYQFVYICDMKGYGWSHIYHPVLNALKLIIENDKKNYPETTRYAFVVNAPAIVSIAWNVIAPILDKRTADKVHIMGGNYQKRLFDVVDPVNLPKFLGGSCDCINDCVPITPCQPMVVFKE